ncbi:MAG: DUF4399 domain-containing protein [Anaerolineae bacterium]|nr:DUF4399 domain-containing protein [Anaerolineae bacterium]
MSDNPRLTPPSSSNDEGWSQILVLFVGVLVLLIVILAATSTNAVPSMADKSADATAEAGGRVFFIEPQDGATVPETFTVQMGAEGVEVAPAGEVVEGIGHFHILVDKDFIAAGDVIPLDTEGYLHFGQAQTETELTLEPGEHILRLQFANGAHQAYEGDAFRDEIHITVE